MQKLFAIAALSVVLAAPAFAQDAKPAMPGAKPAPMAGKIDAAKVTAPAAMPAPTTPAKSASGATIDSKPMAVGGPKMDDKAMPKPATGAAATTTTAAPATKPAMPAPVETKKQ